jgi:hypothetical protein
MQIGKMRKEKGKKKKDGKEGDRIDLCLYE